MEIIEIERELTRPYEEGLFELQCNFIRTVCIKYDDMILWYNYDSFPWYYEKFTSIKATSAFQHKREGSPHKKNLKAHDKHVGLILWKCVNP